MARQAANSVDTTVTSMIVLCQQSLIAICTTELYPTSQILTVFVATRTYLGFLTTY